MTHFKGIIPISIGFLLGVLFSGLFLFIRSSVVTKQMTQLQDNDSVYSSIASFPTTTPNTNESRININLADAAQLESLPGIGPEKANAIIEFRKKYGYFLDKDELLYVPGISKNLYNSIQNLVVVK